MSAALSGVRSRGDWMQTFTGRAFYPLDPRPEDIDPLDIAHALGMVCRYGGHSKTFYSVAEHCVHVSYAVSPAQALKGLLHDATEAYLSDMIRPLKASMPEYRRVEDHLMPIIFRRFGLNGWLPPEVKAADWRILVDERAAVMAPSHQPWASLDGVEGLGVDIQCWSPAVAEARYLARLGELTGGAR